MSEAELTDGAVTQSLTTDSATLDLAVAPTTTRESLLPARLFDDPTMSDPLGDPDLDSPPSDDGNLDGSGSMSPPPSGGAGAPAPGGASSAGWDAGSVAYAGSPSAPPGGARSDLFAPFSFGGSNQAATRLPSTTTLAMSPDPATFGDQVTYTAKMTGTGGTPTGSVTFREGATVLGRAALGASGTASLSIGALSVGDHLITGAYSGDGHFLPSTVSFNDPINPTSTTTALTSSANPSIRGHSVTFTAHVGSSAGTPGGRVTFFDGTTALATQTLTATGTATLTTSALAAGRHTLKAGFATTSANFSASTSAPMTQVVNAAPAFTTGAWAVFMPGQAGTFTIATNGYPTAAITESGSLPSGVTFTDNGDGTAALSGTPATGTAGTYGITLTASNGVSPDATQFLTLTVSHVLLTCPSNQSNVEGDTVSLQALGTVQDAHALTYSLTGAPSGVRIDSSTGAITGAINSGAAVSSPYSATVTVTDGADSNSGTFIWTVSANPIQISHVNDQTNREGDSVSIPLTVTDSTGATPTVTVSGLPAMVQLGGVHTVISGAIAPTAAQYAPFAVTIKATDGTYSTVQTFTWQVSPRVSVSAIANRSNAEGDTVSLQVSASSPGSNPLTFSALNLPDGVGINGTSGAVSGTISPGAANNGPFTTTVTASDGTYAGSQTFVWTVSPRIALAVIPDQSNLEGDTVSVQVSATSPDGHSLTYSVANAPPGVTINSSSGLLQGTVNAGAAAGSPYTTTVTATDGTYSARQNVYWTVTNPTPAAPSITSPNHAAFALASANGFIITTTGTPTPTLTETGTLPTGVTFMDNGDGSATLSGMPADGTQGTYSVTITASNGVGSAATQTFTLTVGGAPAITSPANAAFTIGSNGTFTVTATGTPTPALTETGTLPGGVTFVDNGGGTATLAGTAAAGTAGTYSLTITASNGVGAGFAQNFTLTVNQLAAITSANSTTFMTGTAGTFLVTATGAPTPTLTESGALPGGVTFTDNANGNAWFSGTPAAGTNGSYAITVTATNGVGQPATQSFTLTVNADVITTSSLSYQANAGQALLVSAANGVLTNASGGNGSPLTANLYSSTSHGALSLSSDGSFTYTPTSGFSGSDVFYFTATDGVAVAAAAPVALNVRGGSNQENIAQAHAYVTRYGQQLTVPASSGLLSDAESGVPGWESLMSAEAVTNVAHGTLVPFNGDGSFTYTPAVGFLGEDTFTYHVKTDGAPGLTSETKTVTIEVVPTNVEIVGHQAGTKANPGAPVTEPDEDDPTKLLVLTTTALPKIVDATPNLVQLTLKSLNLANGGSGSVVLTASDPDPKALQFFDSTGKLWDPKQLTVNLATPNLPPGPLSGMLTADVQIYVQVLKPEANLQFKLQYRPLTLNPVYAKLVTNITTDNVDMMSVGVQIDWLNNTKTNEAIVTGPNVAGLPVAIGIPTTKPDPANPANPAGLPYTLPDANMLGDDDVEWVAQARQQPNTQADWTTFQAAPVAIVGGQQLMAQVHVTLVLPTNTIQLLPVSVSLLGMNTTTGSPYGNMTGTLALPATYTGAVQVSAAVTPKKIDVFDQGFAWQIDTLTLNVTNPDGSNRNIQLTNAPLGTTTTNRVYTLLAKPQPVTGIDKPWAKVLEIAAGLAKGSTTPADAAKAMTKGIVNSSWKTFASSAHFLNPTATNVYDPLLNAYLNTVITVGINAPAFPYDLKDFLSSLGTTVMTQRCFDNADLEAILLRSLGVQANAVLYTQRPGTPIVPKPYFGNGRTVPTTVASDEDKFDSHIVVTLGADLTKAPTIYDPSTRRAANGGEYLGTLSADVYKSTAFANANQIDEKLITQFDATGAAPNGFMRFDPTPKVGRTGTTVVVTLKGVGFNDLLTIDTIGLADGIQRINVNQDLSVITAMNLALDPVNAPKNFSSGLVVFCYGPTDGTQIELNDVQVVDAQTLTLTLTVARTIANKDLWIVARKDATEDNALIPRFAAKVNTIQPNWRYIAPGRGDEIRIRIPPP
jgi:hypothetical protein